MEALKIGFGFALGKALFPLAVIAVIVVPLVLCALIGEWRSKRRHAKKGASRG